MSKNENLTAQIKSLSDDKLVLSAAYSQVTEKLASVAMVRDFFNRWVKSGYNDAISHLPQDNPSTVGTNEAVTEADFKKKAEEFFGKSWSSITADAQTDIAKLNNEYVANANAKVRMYIGQQYELNQQRDDKENEIDELQAIEKEDFSID